MRSRGFLMAEDNADAEGIRSSDRIPIRGILPSLSHFPRKRRLLPAFWENGHGTFHPFVGSFNFVHQKTKWTG